MTLLVALTNAAARIGSWLLDRADKRICQLSNELSEEDER